MCVCDPTVTSPVDAASRRPDQDTGGAPYGQRQAGVDERGRQIQRDGDPQRRQHGHRVVDEIGGAVVEA